MKLPIYMDHHATTPVDPRVFEVMRPYFTENFGNAASRNHSFGWRAEEAVEKGRLQIASLIGARPREIVFTSGATEAINLALKGVAERYGNRGNHVITWQTEHRAVLDTCRHLEKKGFRVSYLSVERYGLLSLENLKNAISAKTILISLLFANNDIGVVQPVAAVGKLAREKGIIFHVDGVQALGKIPLSVEDNQIDLLSLSAHKLYGPQGVGALYVRRGTQKVDLAPQIDGGGHERGRRSGTLNVPGIAGFGEACELGALGMTEEAARLQGLRDRLKDGLLSRLDGVSINGSLTARLPHNLHMSFSGVDGESLLLGLDDVAVSSGSACTTADPEPSHVLRALGIPSKLAQASIRFGLGRFNTEEEVDYVIEKVVKVVNRLRELSPAYQKA
jgi:cysteine desulfurase